MKLLVQTQLYHQMRRGAVAMLFAFFEARTNRLKEDSVATMSLDPIHFHLLMKFQDLPSKIDMKKKTEVVFVGWLLTFFQKI